MFANLISYSIHSSVANYHTNWHFSHYLMPHIHFLVQIKKTKLCQEKFTDSEWADKWAAVHHAGVTYLNNQKER